MASVKHLAILWALVRFYSRIVPGDWYRRPPFLPAPPKQYVAWRLQTAYGQRRPEWRDLIRDVWQFGDWLRRFERNV